MSGCPDKKEDHARCCVEMGLGMLYRYLIDFNMVLPCCVFTIGMISAIKDFCHENDVNVDMRIGIHTGIVICGIVGMKRFKVLRLESASVFVLFCWRRPAMVHVSGD